MKYKARIPKPSAKRLEKNRRIVVEASYQPCGGHKFEFLIPEPEADIAEFEFEFDEFELHNPHVDDGGAYYHCYFEYRNSTGSRVEKIPFNWKELVDESNEDGVSMMF